MLYRFNIFNETHPDNDLLRGMFYDGIGLVSRVDLKRNDQEEIFLVRIRLPLLPHVVAGRL